METMRHTLRRLAAVLAGLALVATLPAPCPCPEETAGPRSGHECCAPPTGVSSTDHGCCDQHGDAVTDLLTPGPAPAPSPSGIAVVRVAPVARLASGPHSSFVLSPSPPPAVLRI